MHALEQTDPPPLSVLKSNRFCLSNETVGVPLVEGGLQSLRKDPIDQPSWNCSIVSECEFLAGTRKR